MTVPAGKQKKSNVDTAMKKKRIVQLFRLSFAVMILLLTAATGFIYYHQQECAAARKELYDQLNITFANIDWVEYGTKSVDAKSLIIDSHGEIRADPEHRSIKTFGDNNRLYSQRNNTLWR